MPVGKFKVDQKKKKTTATTGKPRKGSSYAKTQSRMKANSKKKPKMGMMKKKTKLKKKPTMTAVMKKLPKKKSTTMKSKSTGTKTTSKAQADAKAKKFYKDNNLKY